MRSNGMLSYLLTDQLYSESYSYDSATGNLSFKSGIGTYTYDTTHKHAVVATSNGWSFGYDANGNMTQRVVNGQTYTLSYDAEGHLVSVSGPSMSAIFVYDGDGKRVKSVINGVTTYFVGNYYEVSGSTITKYYYAGSQRVAVRVNGTLSYILSDHLSSTSVIANAGGEWAGEQRYKAWGEVRYAAGVMPTRYTYTGQYSYTEGFGLMFYNARWYDPSLGRFAQGDTIVPEGVQGWDRYAYVNNNPLRYVDASGHGVDCGIGESCMFSPLSCKIEPRRLVPAGSTLYVTSVSIYLRGGPGTMSYGNAAQESYTGFYGSGESQNPATAGLVELPGLINLLLVYLRDNTDILSKLGNNPEVSANVYYKVGDSGLEITGVSISNVSYENIGVRSVHMQKYSSYGNNLVSHEVLYPDNFPAYQTINYGIAQPGSSSNIVDIQSGWIYDNQYAEITIVVLSETGRWGNIVVTITVNPP